HQAAQQDTTITIEGPTTANYSTPARFTATVRTASGALVNDGVVAFAYGGLETVDLVNGQAVIDLNLEAGTRDVIAYYRGSAGFRSSQSSGIRVQVSRKASAVRLAASRDFIAAGANIKLTARVDPGPVSGEIGGTVIFKDGS